MHTLTAVNYFPYGSERDGQSYQAPEYNFGFNAMLRDDEFKGDGRSYSTLFREYDPLLGRWMSRDPKEMKYPSQSPYNAFNANPILFNDPSGLDAEVTINGNNVEIRVRIQIYGDNANANTASSMQKALNNAWGGKRTYTDNDKNKYNVKIIAEVSVFPGDPEKDLGKKTGQMLALEDRKVGDLNDMNYIKLTTNPDDFKKGEASFVINGQVGLWLSKKDSEYIWKHEYGHLLGLPDRYQIQSGLTNNNGTGPWRYELPGWENNIMAGPNGKIEQKNINDLMPRVLTQSAGRNKFIYDAEKAKRSDDPVADPNSILEKEGNR